jgi:ribosomal protein S18 acetylase RimI-like enzyme
VAENETKLVGYCVVSSNGSQAEVDSLFVEPDSRKRSTGESLMGAAMDGLKSHGPQSIKVLVGQGNEEVLFFYEKLGFRKRATVMEVFESSWRAS